MIQQLPKTLYREFLRSNTIKTLLAILAITLIDFLSTFNWTEFTGENIAQLIISVLSLLGVYFRRYGTTTLREPTEDKTP